MANELKPCPFCGGIEKVKCTLFMSVFQVQCFECKSSAYGSNNKDQAANSWNTRPAAPVEGLETKAFYWKIGLVKYVEFVTPSVSSGIKAEELVTRSQAGGIIAAERAAIPILKGMAFKSGDGWKDTSKEGEVCFVWNKMHSAPHAPGQYPRVGKEHWSASTENYTFEPATPDEVVKLFSDLEADNAAVTAQRDTLIEAGMKCCNGTPNPELPKFELALSFINSTNEARKAADMVCKDLKADNAALTARVKELEADVSAYILSAEDQDKRRKALETQLAAAQKEFRRIKPTEATSYVLTETLMAAVMRFAENIKGPMTVDKLFKLHVELNKSAMLDSEPFEARAALEAKP